MAEVQEGTVGELGAPLDPNQDDPLSSLVPAALSLIPVVGPLAATGLSLNQQAQKEKERKEWEAYQAKNGGSPELNAFIAELQKPIDWTSAESKFLLGEARGAARKTASDRGLGVTGAGLANTQQAAENAKAKYGLQRQQLLSQALATKGGDARAMEALRLQRSQLGAQSDANQARNIISLVGGLGQTGQTLYTNWQNNQGGLNTGSGLGAAQPTTQTSYAGNVPASNYNAPAPDYDAIGLGSTPNPQPYTADAPKAGQPIPFENV